MTKEQINEFTLRTTQANHSGLVIILFEIEDIYLDDAMVCYNNADLDGFLRNLEMAKRAHHELISSMNTEHATGYKVWNILRYTYKLLIQSSAKKDASGLDRVKAMLCKLKASFAVISEKDTEPPVMKNTHQVYAGLTYGRGKLNESYGAADYSNRGFRI